jgi:hypothetical protein
LTIADKRAKAVIPMGWHLSRPANILDIQPSEPIHLPKQCNPQLQRAKEGSFTLVKAVMDQGCNSSRLQFKTVTG